MARDDETRLFRPEDLLSRDELVADAEGARSPAAIERADDLDAAHMWISKDDGLLVRGVKPHSAQKSTLVSRGIDTVSSAMSGKWFAVKHGVQYVELYSGPGRLLDEGTGVEQAGSPIRALSVRKPFTHYVLSDFSQGCVDALSARVGSAATSISSAATRTTRAISNASRASSTRGRSSLRTSIQPAPRICAGRRSNTSPRSSGSSTSSSTCR